MEFSKHIQWCVRTNPDNKEKLKIYGELYLPQGAEQSAFTHLTFPTVILAHPFGRTHGVLEPYARMLAGLGMAVYGIDFCGGGKDSKSDLKTTEMSLETEAADLEAALSLMREEPFCDKDNVFLLGASQGGVVASLVAGRRPDQVKAVVLLYPAYSIPEDAKGLFGGREVPESYDMLGTRVGARYVRDAMACKPYDELKAFGGSVLIMHGDCDGLVPLAYSKRAQRRLPNVRLEVIEGGKHGFSGEALERSFELLKMFLANEVAHLS